MRRLSRSAHTLEPLAVEAACHEWYLTLRRAMAASAPFHARYTKSRDPRESAKMLGKHNSARLVVFLRMGLCELADHSLANEQRPLAIFDACLSSVRALPRCRRARETLSPPRPPPPPMHPLLCARVVLRFSAPHKTCLCSYAILAECVKPHIRRALAGTEPLRLPAEVSLPSGHSEAVRGTLRGSRTARSCARACAPLHFFGAAQQA
jgi:hypothetical protein